MNEIRKNLFMKYLGAKEDWKAGNDIFYLESWADTWVHIDVREFSQTYLTKVYFVKNNNELNGKSIIDLAKDLGFGSTCSCKTGFSSNDSDIILQTELIQKL